MSGPSQNSRSANPMFLLNKTRTKKADQNTPLVRRLVRLVRFGPLWSGLVQVIEITKENADQIWTKTGPRTTLDHSPRSFRTGGGSVIGLKGLPS